MSLIYLAEGLVVYQSCNALFLLREEKKLTGSKNKMKIFGKLIFVNELTSLCQVMLITTTNLVSLVTHADTHDQDQELGKKGKADTLSQK